MLFRSGCSISSLGEAASVRLFSKWPFREIQSLALDASSLTSNHLAQVLLAERYGVRPTICHLAPDLSAMLSQADACVLIGDKGMEADGAGLEVMDLGSEWVAMMSPGVQNPHCTAPASTNACCTSLSEPAGAIPSMVVMAWPTALAAITRQPHTSAPSTSTLHEPHSPCSHAPFEPINPRRSRKT